MQFIKLSHLFHFPALTYFLPSLYQKYLQIPFYFLSLWEFLKNSIFSSDIYHFKFFLLFSTQKVMCFSISILEIILYRCRRPALPCPAPPRRDCVIAHCLDISFVQSVSPVQLSATPWTGAHQAPLSVGFPRRRTLEWAVVSFSRGLPDPGAEAAPPALAGRGSTPSCQTPSQTLRMRLRFPVGQQLGCLRSGHHQQCRSQYLVLFQKDGYIWHIYRFPGWGATGPHRVTWLAAVNRAACFPGASPTRCVANFLLYLPVCWVSF